MILNFLLVGLGGGIGAMLRYAISSVPYKGNFPIQTLVINIMGAIAIGFIAGLAAEKKLSDKTTLFLKTGVCGGYTTFSTFSLEAYQLIHNGNTFLGVLYVALSVVGCIFGVWVGMSLTKFFSKV